MGWILLLPVLLLFVFRDSHGMEKSINLIHIKGSETMLGVLQVWAKGYHTLNPGVEIEVNGGGSGNGIAALINGHVEMAATSRPLKERENRLMARRSGQYPIAHVVGRDAVTILVHKTNPLNGITQQQLARVYGKKDAISNWSELGVQVPGCPGGVIQRFGRRNNSGDHIFFRQAILGRRAYYHPDLISFKSAEKLVQEVTDSPCSIGFASMAKVTDHVKILCVAADDPEGAPCFPPTADFTRSGQYPLFRPLYFYALNDSNPMVRAFIEWIQGREGQEILRTSGFVSHLGTEDSSSKGVAASIPSKP